MGTSYRVVWASLAAASGYAYDVQIKRPGSTAFSDWQLGLTKRYADFVPDVGTGRYQFRARIRDTATQLAVAYSSPVAVTVS